MARMRRLSAVILAVLLLFSAFAAMPVSAGGDEHEITIDAPYSMHIDVDGETVMFSPDEDGWYRFYTIGEYDTYVELYNSNWEGIDFADDTVEGMNFSLKVKLYAGYVYYLDIFSYGIDDGQTAEFDLYVEETVGVESAAVIKEPDCATVVEGYEEDTLNVDGLEVEFILSDGTTVDWSYDEGGTVAGSEVSIYTDDDGLNNYFIDIECDEAFDRFFYTTIENPVDYIVFTGTPVEFYENTCGYYDEYDHQFYYTYDLPHDGEITVYYKDGTSVTASVFEKVRETYVTYTDEQDYTPWSVGSDNYITLDYLGVTTDIPVTILETPFVDAVINSSPERVYIYGDREWGIVQEGIYYLYPEDIIGLSVTLEDENGNKTTYTEADFDTKNYELDGYMYEFSVVECSKAGKYEAVLNFKGFDIRYEIEVADTNIASIEILEQPDITEYEAYYYPYLYGMKVRVNFKDSTSETVVLSEENIEYIYKYGVVYAIAVGEDVLYVYDEYDSSTDTSYSSLNCNGVRKDYRGISYTDVRNVESIVPEHMTYNGDGAKFKVVYTNGDEEEFEFDSVLIEEYMDGMYEGFAKTQSGIAYYDIAAVYKDDVLVGYEFYFLGDVHYIDVSELTEPENPSETEPVIMGLMGDADCDDKVNIKDATAIQKHIASLVILSETGLVLADVDANTNVNIKDATAIQKYIAGIETGLDIGKRLSAE